MKLTQKQLKSIIEEEVHKMGLDQGEEGMSMSYLSGSGSELDEADTDETVDMTGEWAEAMVDALDEYALQNGDDCSRALASIMGKNVADDIPVPVRSEDLEATARSAAKRAITILAAGVENELRWVITRSLWLAMQKAMHR